MREMDRPVFFNLTQIQMPVGALASIGHRISGVVLALGLPFVIHLLAISLHSAQDYARVLGWLAMPAWKLAFVLYVWALAHHCLAGIRHLLSDVDVGSFLAASRRSAWTVNVGGVVVALVAWLVLP